MIERDQRKWSQSQLVLVHDMIWCLGRLDSVIAELKSLSVFAKKKII